MDYQAIRNASSYEEILYSLHLATLKLRLTGRNQEEIQRYFTIVWRMLAGEAEMPELSLAGLANALAEQKGLTGKDTEKNRNILLTTYQHINDPGISLQTLAREKLFMNEEHLGRLFLKLTGMRFSAFVEDRRMRQAKQLLQFRPDLKISRLAELVGYPADGQYFSRSFRKIYGVTPSEYRDSL